MASTKRKRRLTRAGLFLFASLLVLLAMAPSILSVGFFKSALLSWAGRRAGVRLGAEGWRLTWFGRQTVHGLAVESPDGRALARVGHIRLEQGLAGLLWDRSRLGPLSIEDVDLEPELLALASALAAREEAPEEPPEGEKPPPERMAPRPAIPTAARIRNVTLHTRAGAVRLVEADFATGEETDTLTARLEIERETRRGTARVEVELEGLSRDWRGWGALGATVDARFENVAVAPLAGALAPSDASFEAGGVVSGNLKASRTRAGAVTIETEWRGRGLWVTGAFLHGDRPALDVLDLALAATYADRTLDVKALSLESPLVEASAEGTFRFAPLADEHAVTGAGRAGLRVSLARLAEMMPRTLGLREDVIVRAGSLAATLKSERSRNAAALRVDAGVTGLRGVCGGRPISFSPVTLTADLERDDRGVNVKGIHLDTIFGSVKGRGRVEAFSLDAHVDLASATEEVGRFGDLGGRSAKGTVDAHLETRGDFDSGLAVTGSAALADVCIYPAEDRCWREPRADLTLAARVAFNDERRAENISVEDLSLAASGGTLKVTGGAKRSAGAWNVTASVQGDGDVAVLVKQVTDCLGRPAINLAGRWRLDAGVEVPPSRPFALHLAGGAKNLVFQTGEDETMAGLQNVRAQDVTLTANLSGPPPSADAETGFLSGLVGDGSLGVGRIDCDGVRGDEGVIRWKLADGQVNLTPDSDHPSGLKVSEGLVRLDGCVDLRTDPPRWRLDEPLRLADGIRLHSRLAKEFLRHISPLVGFTVNPEGVLFVTLEEADIPLGSKIKEEGRVRGEFRVEDFRAELAEPLATAVQLAGLNPTTKQRLFGPVPIDLRDGLFYLHDSNVELVEGVRLQAKGTVGLDGRLDITLGLPLTRNLLRRVGIQVKQEQLLVDQALTIPMTGTLDKPVVDPKALLRHALDLGLGIILRGLKDGESLLEGIEKLLKKPAEKSQDEGPF
ncbi:MAG: hypothetical protein WBC59_02280 [Phycisphaerae bacterium]